MKLSGIEHDASMHLRQPLRLMRQVRQMLQTAAIFRHMAEVVIDMIAKIQALPGRLTDTPLADRGNRTHIGCSWPPGFNPWIFYHLAVLPAGVAYHPE